MVRRFFSFSLFHFFTLSLLLTSCNGVGFMDKMYDDPSAVISSDSTLIINATQYDRWAYIDLHALTDSINAYNIGMEQYKPSFLPTFCSIPLDETSGEMGSESTGVYYCWYDIFGKGLSNNRLATDEEVADVKSLMSEKLQKEKSKFPTASQPTPASWDIAFHFCNVRTNGGSVYNTGETLWTNIGTAKDYANKTFTADTWNQNWVWIERNAMLKGIIPCQGIYVNEELGTWLQFAMENFAPKWTHSNEIYILKMSDGSMAALQLVDYKSSGKSCNLEIKFKYPI